MTCTVYTCLEPLNDSLILKYLEATMKRYRYLVQGEFELRYSIPRGQFAAPLGWETQFLTRKIKNIIVEQICMIFHSSFWGEPIYAHFKRK